MKKIVCEMCECTVFVKENGFFVCQECGCKYPPDEARKLMVEINDTSVTDAKPPMEATKKPVAAVQILQEETEPSAVFEQAPVVSPETSATVEHMPEEQSIPEDQPIAPENDSDDPRYGFSRHTAASPNRIHVEVGMVGHETYTAKSMISLSAFLGEPEPDFVEGPDVAGHIGAAIQIRNMAGKSIKYIVVYLTPYNSVGDAVCCTVEGHSTYGIEVTGPMPAGEGWQGYSDGMWYNGSIVRAEVAFATVEYFDGSKEWFDADSLVKKEAANGSVTNVTVYYDCNSSAPQELMYTLDGEKKPNIRKGQKATFCLKPGYHSITVRNPMMKREFTFQAIGDKVINIYGKAFSMDFYEK